MKTDKDRPSSWRPYKNGMCDTCNANCCTMPVEIKLSDLIRLELVSQDEADSSSSKKIAKRLMKDGIVKSYRQGTEFFMLEQKNNSDCIFLNEKRLCTVYHKRPDTCREFPSIGPRPGYCPVGPKKN